MLTRSQDVQERFRKVSGTIYFFPLELDAKDFEIIGFFQGERLNKSPELKHWHFDCIQYIGHSKDAKKDDIFIHAIGSRQKEKSFTVLLMRKK